MLGLKLNHVSKRGHRTKMINRWARGMTPFNVKHDKSSRSHTYNIQQDKIHTVCPCNGTRLCLIGCNHLSPKTSQPCSLSVTYNQFSRNIPTPQTPQLPPYMRPCPHYPSRLDHWQLDFLFKSNIIDPLWEEATGEKVSMISKWKVISATE